MNRGFGGDGMEILAVLNVVDEMELVYILIYIFIHRTR